MDYVFVFIFGAIVGSFLNVVILRYNTGQSVIKGGSKCFICGKNLKWHELIPVMSFIIQKGRCRNCKSRISIQYPIVELLTGLIFLLTFLKFQFTDYWLLTTGYYFVIFSLLIVIAVYDLRHQIIPNGFVYAFDILAFLNLIQVSSFKFQVSSFLAGLAFFAFFAAIWFLSRGKAMGFGDAKLALGIGWLLGPWQGFWALLFSFCIGSLVGISLVVFSKKSYNMKSKISFGPFLVLGTLIAFFINSNI